MGFIAFQIIIYDHRALTHIEHETVHGIVIGFLA
jgi:hypothetical protein